MACSIRIEYPGAFYHVMARVNRHYHLFLKTLEADLVQNTYLHAQFQPATRFVGCAIQQVVRNRGLVRNRGQSSLLT